MQVEVTLRKGDEQTFRHDTAALAGNLQKAIVRRLEPEAREAVQGIRGVLGGGGSLRPGLAAGTQMRVTRGRGAEVDVHIETTGRALPAAKQPMVFAYDRPSFRHPTYGHAPEVTQAGRPYFRATLDPRTPRFEAAMRQAGVDAARTVRQAKVIA